MANALTTNVKKFFAGIFSSPLGWGLFGKIAQSITYSRGLHLKSEDKRITQLDRTEALLDSRNLQWKTPEINAVLDLMAELIVGDGFRPIYRGKNNEWGIEAADWLENSVFPTFGPQGIDNDWQTSWKMVFKHVFIDGDILCIPYRDRNGMPHCDFVEGSRVANRAGVDVIPDGKRFGG